jgi:hypothetical protein
VCIYEAPSEGVAISAMSYRERRDEEWMEDIEDGGKRKLEGPRQSGFKETKIEEVQTKP